MSRYIQLHRSSARSPARDRVQPAHRAFTIVEVMLAAGVMVMVIATSITVLQAGMRAVDTARNMTLASQICQSALDVLRLQNWTQITALPLEAPVNINEAISSGSTTTLDTALNAITARFTCVRTVSTPKTNMRRILITVSWRGVDGRAHVVSSESRYAKNGLNDYIYTAHR